jgi:hypothetical protein
MRCSQCNDVNAWTLANCRSCGAPLAASATASPGAAPNPAARSNPAAGPNPGGGVRVDGPPAPYGPRDASPAGVPAFAFDARRWTVTDQVAGGATLILLVSLFLPWFGTSGGLFSVSVDGMWHGYMVIAVVLALTILGYPVLRAGFGSLPFGLSATTAERLLAGAAGLNLLLALVSFATKPVGTTWQYGAFIGLAAAIVAAALPIRSVMAGRHG